MAGEGGRLRPQLGVVDPASGETGPGHVATGSGGKRQQPGDAVSMFSMGTTLPPSYEIGASIGLDTPVGERGGQLSAGERQLVALVRAWIADPALLVLDEATSAVDPALEVRLRRAIERLTAGRTSITVAHRLSTAEAADEVLVFERGRLVERGRHDDLLTRGGAYAALHADWATGTKNP